MELPKVKDIKSKFSSAKLLGSVGKNYLQFKLRRTTLKRFKSREFGTVVVDMDGTLYDTDVSLEGLMLIYGDYEGERIYDSLVSRIASGELSIEEAIIEGNEFLIKKGMAKKDFERVLERVLPFLRKPLVRALKKMKKSGKTLVLATLSSKEFGELLNAYIEKKYGFSFDFVLGTELAYDKKGAIIGVANIVGTKDGDCAGVSVATKLSSIRSALASKGKELDLSKTVFITDSYGDIDTAKMFVTILIKPKEPSTVQKVSQRLKLADYILPDGPELQRNLESIILGPSK